MQLHTYAKTLAFYSMHERVAICTYATYIADRITAGETNSHFKCLYIFLAKDATM